MRNSQSVGPWPGRPLTDFRRWTRGSLPLPLERVKTGVSPAPIRPGSKTGFDRDVVQRSPEGEGWIDISQGRGRKSGVSADTRVGWVRGSAAEPRIESGPQERVKGGPPIRQGCYQRTLTPAGVCVNPSVGAGRSAPNSRGGRFVRQRAASRRSRATRTGAPTICRLGCSELPSSTLRLFSGGRICG